MEKLAGMVITNGTKHQWPRRMGSSIVWEPGNGTGIWIHVNNDNVIECVTPILVGNSPLNLFVKSRYIDPTCPHCSGLILEKRETEAEESIELQIAIQLADYEITKDLIQINKFQPVSFAGIAEEIGIYKDEEDFNKNSEKLPEGQMYATESFIPAGLFAQDPKDVSSQAFLSGTVRFIERREGIFTDPCWYYGKIATLGMTIECAFDEEQGAQIKEGYIVQGTYWLVGGASKTWERKRFFDRIFT